MNTENVCLTKSNNQQYEKTPNNVLTSTPAFFALDQLPDHILLTIFVYSQPHELCHRLSRVSRRFHRLIYSSSLWCGHTVRYAIDETSTDRNNSFGILVEKMSSAIRRLDIFCAVDDETHPFSLISLATFETIFRCELPVLTYLRYSVNSDYESVSILELLSKRMPNLTTLHMEYNERRDETFIELMHVLAKPTIWPHLHHFELKSFYKDFDDDSLEKFFRSDKQLASFRIGTFTNSPVRVFVAHQHRSITSISVEWRLSDADMLVLTNCTKLIKLAICCRDLTDVSLGYIKQMTTINHLHINECRANFTENAICSLFDVNDGGMHQLKYLRIANCKHLNDRCVDAITECCTKLESLSIGESDSTTERSLLKIVQRLSHIRFLSFRTGYQHKHNYQSSNVEYQSTFLDHLLKSAFFKSIELIVVYNLSITKSTLIELIKHKRHLILIMNGRYLDETNVDNTPRHERSCYWYSRREHLRDHVAGGCCIFR